MIETLAPASIEPWMFCHLYWLDKWVWIPKSFQWEKYQPWLCFQMPWSPPFCLTVLYPHSEVKVTQSCLDSLQPHGLYSSWNSPGQNTGAGSLSLLQGISPAQGSNPSLWHCRRILYQLSRKGSLCHHGYPDVLGQADLLPVPDLPLDAMLSVHR